MEHLHRKILQLKGFLAAYKKNSSIDFSILIKNMCKEVKAVCTDLLIEYPEETVSGKPLLVILKLNETIFAEFNKEPPKSTDKCLESVNRMLETLNISKRHIKKEFEITRKLRSDAKKLKGLLISYNEFREGEKTFKGKLRRVFRRSESKEDFVGKIDEKCKEIDRLCRDEKWDKYPKIQQRLESILVFKGNIYHQVVLEGQSIWGPATYFNLEKCLDYIRAIFSNIEWTREHLIMELKETQS